MSTSALFIITDEQSVLNACQDWVPPLPHPRIKNATNPFTGNAYEVQTQVPETLEANLREPTVQEVEAGLQYKVLDRLREAQPIAVEFTVSNDVWVIYKDSPPFLFGDVHGEVHQIRRIEQEKETTLLKLFDYLTGPWISESYRRKRGLSLFIYMRVSGNSQGIDDPLNLTVLIATAMVVADQ